MDERARKLRDAATASDSREGAVPAGRVEERCPLKRDWIEIQLLGEDGKGIADEPYLVALPDGSQRRGKLNAYGLARLEGLPSGECRVCFPAIDARAWETA